MRKARFQEDRDLIESILPRVTIEIRIEVLDVDLATDPVSQEGNVRTDHSAQIHDLDRGSRTEQLQKRGKRRAPRDRFWGCGRDLRWRDDHRTLRIVRSSDALPEARNEIRQPATLP